MTNGLCKNDEDDDNDGVVVIVVAGDTKETNGPRIKRTPITTNKNPCALSILPV